jgi:hypothetical protein
MKTRIWIAVLLLSASALSALQPPEIVSTTQREGVCFYTAKCPQIVWEQVNGATYYTVYRDGRFLFNTVPWFFIDDFAVPEAVHTYQVTARRDMPNGRTMESNPSESVTIYNGQE